MGGSASKAARKLPTTTPSVTRAATAPHPPPQAAPTPQAEAFDYGRPRKSEPFSGEKDDGKSSLHELDTAHDGLTRTVVL